MGSSKKRRREKSSSSSSDSEPRPKRTSRTSPERRQDAGPSSDADARLSRLEELMGRMSESMASTSSLRAPRHVMGRSELIPEFAPDNLNLTCHKWLEKIDQLAHVNGWDEQTTTFNMLSRLSGLAKNWCDSLDASTYSMSWTAWKALLERTFPDNNDFAAPLKKMIHRVKTNGESWAQYYFGKLSLLQACGIDGRKAVSCILDGITDSNLKNGVIAGRYETPEALYAEYLSTLKCGESPTVSNNTSSDVVRQPQGHVSIQNSRSSWKKCYNCGRRGHVAARCLEPIKCRRCGRSGHREAVCLLKPSVPSRVETKEKASHHAPPTDGDE